MRKSYGFAFLVLFFVPIVASFVIGFWALVRGDKDFWELFLFPFALLFLVFLLLGFERALRKDKD